MGVSEVGGDDEEVFWGEWTVPSNCGMGVGEGGRWAVQGTCLLQGGVTLGGPEEGEWVSGVLGGGEVGLSEPGA